MDNKNNNQVQCHFISNTHWDREWRFSARRTQYMLGYMLDMLIDIIEKNPEYKHFHLDSQTMPVQDYLEVYPEKKELFKKLVSEGKAYPCFCTAEELAEVREKQEADKLTPGYYGSFAKCRNLSYEEIEEKIKKREDALYAHKQKTSELDGDDLVFVYKNN